MSVEVTMAPAGAGEPKLFGLAAEFDSPEAIVAAAQKVTELGFTRAEAYLPFPVDGLPDAFGVRHSPMSKLVGCAAIVGACTGYGMEWFANVVHYRLNVGGRPPNSWPMFIPITFELAILFGATFGVIMMLVLNKLPQPYHPMFRLERFKRASRDRFFLCIESSDPRFDRARTATVLESLAPLAVLEVPA